MSGKIQRNFSCFSHQCISLWVDFLILTFSQMPIVFRGVMSSLWDPSPFLSSPDILFFLLRVRRAYIFLILTPYCGVLDTKLICVSCYTCFLRPWGLITSSYFGYCLLSYPVHPLCPFSKIFEFIQIFYYFLHYFPMRRHICYLRLLLWYLLTGFLGYLIQI